jgi:hypothetical protein
VRGEIKSQKSARVRGLVSNAASPWRFRPLAHTPSPTAGGWYSQSVLLPGRALVA